MNEPRLAPDDRERPPETGAGRRWLLIAILAAAAFLTHSRALGHEFLLWDDDLNVTHNAALRPPDLEAVAGFWREPFSGMYVPASYTLWAIETRLAESGEGGGPGDELDPALFHAGSLLLHCACALLVFGLLRRLVGSDLPALAGALLFALHPLQVEAVAWVSETRGVLSTTFSLLALWLYLRPREGPDRASGASRARYALATLCFALALLSKPSAVVVPLMALVLDAGPLGRGVKRSLLLLAPWLLLALADVLVTKLAQSDETIGFVAPLLARPWIAADALGFYLGKLAWPFGLAAEYGRTPERVLEQGWGGGTWALPCLLAGLLLLLRPRRAGLVAAALFLVGVSPVLGLVPFVYQDISTVADRYLYLAMLGPALALASWLAARERRAAAWIAFALLAALAARSFDQQGSWRDTRALFEHSLSVNPLSHIACNNLGLVSEREGKPEAAERHYLAALDIKPDHHKSHMNLGNVYLGRVEDPEASNEERERWLVAAMERYRRAIDIRPGYWKARFHLGQALAAAGRPKAAVAQLRRALAGARAVRQEAIAAEIERFLRPLEGR